MFNSTANFNYIFHLKGKMESKVVETVTLIYLKAFGSEIRIYMKFTVNFVT